MKFAASTTQVSIVVPTFRRSDLLARCLDALGRQQFRRDSYEILVCDDAASAATERQVAALARRWDGRPALRYLAALDTRGPAGARNLGWRTARGEIIAFTDDDTIARPDWLRLGVSAFEPDIAAVTGVTEMPLPEPPSDYERDAAGLTRSEFITANCFVRLSALHSVGGFDERYAMAWREDSDLHFALLNHGLKIKRNPCARIVHPLRPVRYAAGLGMQKKVMYDMLLRRKYPTLYRDRIRARAPRHYLAITAALASAVMLAALGHYYAAASAAAVWLAMSVLFFMQRQRGTRRSWRNLTDLAITSACIPVLSIYWRLVGMLRFGRAGRP